MQRQFVHKEYGTVLLSLFTILEGIGKRDSLYQLNGSDEFDVGYFEPALFLSKQY